MTLRENWESRFTELDQRPIWQWITEEGELPSSYAVTGRFDVSTCPMVKGPMAAWQRPHVRNVVVMSGVQCLKTLTGELLLLWSIVNNPGPIQWLFCTNDEAKEHAQERFLDLLNSFPAVARYYSENRHEKTTCFIKFLHCYMRLEGVETKKNLQRKSIKIQMRSEVWQSRYWVPGKLKEADSRLTQFAHNSKTYTESQPGDAAYLGTDDMDMEYCKGNQNVWGWRCYDCRKIQPHTFSVLRPDGTRAGIRWDTTETTRRPNGEWRWGELAQTIRTECLFCGHRHYDEPLTRRRMLDDSEYITNNPDCDPQTESFSWNQWAMPNLPWFESKIGGVKNFLIAHEQAKRGFDVPLKEFMQKVCGEPYDPERHGAFARLATVEIQSKADDKTGWIEFQGITFKHHFLDVDVQADHFWALVESWSDTGDSLTRWAGQLFTWDEIEEVQRKFNVQFEDVGVDVSHRSIEVVRECARRGHWVATKRGKFWLSWKAFRGSDQENFAFIPQRGPQKGQRIMLPYAWPPAKGDPCQGLPSKDPRRLEYRGKYCTIVTWSNPSIKDVVIKRRDGRAEKAQSLVDKGEWNETFSHQMFSQKKVPIQGRYGGTKWKWQKFRDDHLFDCRCMSVLRAFMRHLMGGQEVDQDDSQQDPPSKLLGHMVNSGKMSI